MKTTHLCLVSDQTIPDILAAEHFSAEELLIVSAINIYHHFKIFEQHFIFNFTRIAIWGIH